MSIKMAKKTKHGQFRNVIVAVHESIKFASYSMMSHKDVFCTCVFWNLQKNSKCTTEGHPKSFQSRCTTNRATDGLVETTKLKCPWNVHIFRTLLLAPPPREPRNAEQAGGPLHVLVICTAAAHGNVSTEESVGRESPVGSEPLRNLCRTDTDLFQHKNINQVELCGRQRNKNIGLQNIASSLFI